jgi:hypothetical protein
MPRRRLLEGAAAGAAAVMLPRLPSGGVESASAAPARDPVLVRSWGGLAIPPAGLLWGADDTTRGFTGPKGIEIQLGRRMGIRDRRYGWLVPCPNAKLAADARLTGPPVVPMVSMTGLGGGFPVKSAGWQGGGDRTVTGYGQGLDRITNGEFDGYWTTVARGLEALKIPVLFRLFMEMNGDHNPFAADWQGGVDSGGQDAFIRMWQHVWTVFHRNGATLAAGGHCIFVFCAQRMSTSGSWKTYWPGDNFVDWSGVDLYRTTFEYGAQNHQYDYDTYLWAVDHHKPFIVCESGFAQGKAVWTSAGKFDKDGSVTGHSLIDNAHAAVKVNPQCVAYLSWNNIGPITNDFIDTSARSLRQYRAFANDAACAVRRQLG